MANNGARRIVPFIIVTMLIGLAAVLSLQGQDQVPPRDQRIPRYDASAVVKLVAVRVVDEAGRPVPGLRKEDFVLMDNGEMKTITEFESHVLTAAGMAMVPAEPGSPVPPQAAVMNRKIFIFLDLQGSDENGNSNAKAAALAFVDSQLRPGDEVAVLGFSPMRGFFIQEYLTADLEGIRKAIEGALELPPSHGGMEMPPNDTALETSAESGGIGGVMAAGAEVSGQAYLGKTVAPEGPLSEISGGLFVGGTDIFERWDFLPRMSDLAQALKFVPGSKSLVLFSGRDLGPAAVALGRSFADAGTPVYTVNTKNWIMRGGVKEHYIWKEHPLKDMSLASGGEYFADIWDVKTISQGVQELTGNYYVLGYYVKENWDGAYHRIKVELRKPGFRVLAQEGYFNPKPFTEMSAVEKELQLFDLLYSEKPASAEGPDLPMAALNTTLPGSRDGMILVELDVDAKSGIAPSKVELFGLVRNESLSPIVSLKWGLDLSSYDGKTVVLWARPPREPGAYDGRFIVRDTVSGRSAVGRVRFAVKAPTRGDIVLASPVLLVPGAEPKIGRLPSGPARRGAHPEPTFSESYPFIPRGHRIVVRYVESGTSEILAVVPVKVRTSAPGRPLRIDVGGRLLSRPAGEEVVLDLEVVEIKTSSDGRQFLIVRILLPQLGPGEYELQIEAVDAGSGATDAVRTALVLK